MYLLAQCLLFFGSLILDASLGILLLRLIGKLSQKFVISKNDQELICSDFFNNYSTTYTISFALVLGLSFHLGIAVFLCCLNVIWWVAWILPLIPAVYFLPELWRLARRVQLAININFGLWLLVHIILATSLFSVSKTISTIWANNYGDLTFHLGMIKYMIVSQKFPPELHIYPGAQQGYPVLVNFWTATIALIEDSFRHIKIIFVWQWLTIWTIIFFLLQGAKNKLLPWVVLFSGGSYFVWKKFSWVVLSDGYPWTVFISTIWVTQRSALLGALLLIAAISFFEKMFEKQRFAAILIAGSMLSIGVLAHVHFVLVGLLYIGFRVLCSLQVKELCKNSIAILIIAAPLLLFIPLISNKSSIFNIMYGWTVGKEIGPLISIKMWLSNCWQILPLLLFFLFKRKFFPQILILTILFLLGNFVKISYWNWDQIKFFLGIYLILLVLVEQLQLSGKLKLFFSVSLILLLIPGAFETIKIFYKFQNSAIYSTENIKQAAQIAKSTPRNAIIAGAANHNHLVTLTGRRLFHGYMGTLVSHGINSGKLGRRNTQFNLHRLVRCKIDNLDQFCPDYLVWTEAERKFWRQPQPPLNLLEKTELPYLFKLKSKNDL